jgi:hypothetical protein
MSKEREKNLIRLAVSSWFEEHRCIFEEKNRTHTFFISRGVVVLR